MTTYKVTFLIVAAVAIFSIPTTESQSLPKRPLSLTPQRYPQPSRNDQDSGPPGPPGPSVHPRRFNYFDQELLKVAAEQIQGNFMISPASIKSTLAMLLEAAKGKAATELRQALRLPEDTNLQRELFKSFLTTTNLQTEGVILQSANRIFLNDQLPPNSEYQEVLKKYYNAEVHSTNFGDQQGAVKLINDWISYATDYKITDFISGGDFDPATIMIMANALYFKGNWQVAFEQDATRRRCFYSTGVECRPVNMMEMQSDFNFGYIEALNSNAIEIPYKGDKFSMLIILPKEQGDVSSVVRDLTHVNFKDILNQMSESEVQLSLPKFKFDYESELIPLLKKVGISEVFTPNANLSNIVVGGLQNPQVNSVIHKTHIEVSEKGAEAAAVTGAVVIPLMGTTLEVMNINHPFLFFIRDKTTGAILFGGRVNEPTPYQDSQRAQGQASASAGRRPTAQQTSGRPNIGNARNPSPQSFQNRPLISPVYKNPVPNQQDSSNNFNSRNQQQSAGKDQDTFSFSSRGAEAITGGSQQAATTPRYNLRSRVITTSPPQTYVRQFNEAQDTQIQDYNRRQSEAANQRRAYEQQQKPNVDSQTEQNRQEEHRQINGQVYQNRPNEHGQFGTLLKGSKTYAQAARVQPSYSASPQANQQSYTQQSYTQQSYTQQPYYGQYKVTPIRIRRQNLDCTTTHCELKTLPVNEADLRHYREQELKQHQEKLISEENLRQHLEYELKQKQEQELNQQQQQLISEQIYQQHQEEEARQKEINAENLRKSQELERRQIEAQKLNQEERERQELKIKQELEDLAVKQHDEELRHQEAQAELLRQNQEHEFQQKVAEEKLLNQQKSQELKQLRAQSLEEHNHRQQLEQELKQKQEQERILQQRQEEEFQLRHQQEQLILEQNLRLQNETQQKEQLIQEENFRIRQEQELKQKQEQELKNQAEKLQYEQNLRQLQEAEQRQIEAQAELIRQIQEIELRQKEAQELKLNKIQGLQQEQSSLSEHQQLVQNPHVSDHNPGQYTAFNPGQSSANNPIQYSNQNLGQNSDFANGGQQYQHQNSFGRRA